VGRRFAFFHMDDQAFGQPAARRFALYDDEIAIACTQASPNEFVNIWYLVEGIGEAIVNARREKDLIW
jgi:hypothetical protein